MDKLEYGDLNRFYVSLGIALILGAIGALWLFMKEPFDLGRTVDQIQKLTPLAQDVVAQRQHWASIMIRVLPRAAVLVMVSGVVCLVYGLVRWRPSQILLDRRRLAETLQVERDARPMDETEIFAKGKANVALQIATSRQRTTDRATVGTTSIDAEVIDYLKLESDLLNSLSTSLPSNFELLRQQRIGQFTFDALIRSRDLSGKNYILEFKVLPPGSTMQPLDAALKRAAHAANWLAISGYGSQVPLVVAVALEATGTLIEQAQQLMSDNESNPTAFGSALLRMVPEQRIRSLSAKDVENLLDVKKRFWLLIGDG